MKSGSKLFFLLLLLAGHTNAFAEGGVKAIGALGPAFLILLLTIAYFVLHGWALFMYSDYLNLRSEDSFFKALIFLCLSLASTAALLFLTPITNVIPGLIGAFFAVLLIHIIIVRNQTYD